ncbi:hypothetical protein BKA93DRAFT_726829 [Sparassis latifolia]
MGNQISRAQFLAVSSFLVNFSVQTYGMLSSPNTKQVADANHFAFSPNPWFIAAFFSGQVALQVYWIRQLFNLNGEGYRRLDVPPPNTSRPLNKSMAEINEEAVKTALDYVPVYALGNLCIAGWLFFWLRENFAASQVLVTINTVAQLLAVVRLPPLTASSSRLLLLTHLVANTFAGIGVLDFIDNGGVALVTLSCTPSTLVQALTCILFPIATAASTPLFGSILLYDILAIFAGQWPVAGAGEWTARLGWTALGMGVIVWLNGLTSLRNMRTSSASVC